MSNQLFQVRDYTPDNELSATGLVMLFAALSLAGALLGLVAHFIGQWFYLILLFPIVIGVVLGIVGAGVITKAKIRNPIAVGVAGLLAGVFAMLVMHYADYLTVKKDVESALAANADVAKLAALSEEDWVALQAHWQSGEEGVEAPAQEDIAWLTEVRGIYAAVLSPEASFLSYMQMNAHQGVSIGRATSSGSGLNLGYIGSWIYWVLEVLIVAGIAFFMLVGSAKEPFCSYADEWKTENLMMVMMTVAEQAKRAVGSGRMQEIEALPEGPEPVFFALYPSPSDNPSATCEVFLQGAPKKEGEERPTLARFTYPNNAWDAFVDLAKKVHPPEPAEPPGPGEQQPSEA